MVHCGFEGTAASDSIRHPFKFMNIARKGIRTTGPMAPEISLANQRPAEDVHSSHVERELAIIREANPNAGKRVVNA